MIGLELAMNILVARVRLGFDSFFTYNHFLI